MSRFIALVDLKEGGSVIAAGSPVPQADSWKPQVVRANVNVGRLFDTKKVFLPKGLTANRRVAERLVAAKREDLIPEDEFLVKKTMVEKKQAETEVAEKVAVTHGYDANGSPVVEEAKKVRRGRKLKES